MNITLTRLAAAGLVLLLAAHAQAQGGRSLGPSAGLQGDPAVPRRSLAILPALPWMSGSDLLSEWTCWWEVDKVHYLSLEARRGFYEPGLPRGRFEAPKPFGPRRARYGSTLHASLEQLRDIVTPALRRALEETDERDIASACLIALAKIGLGDDLGAVLGKYIASADPDLSETAVLALGIAGLEQALPGLLEIFKNTDRGAELVGDPFLVSRRKRAFAGYALGLIGHASKKIRVKRAIYEAAREVLDATGTLAAQDVPVAALHAMRLLGPDPADPGGASLILEASRYLLEFFEDEKNGPQARAHAPAALSSLIGRDPVPRLGAFNAEAIDRFVRMARDRGTHPLLVQSCVLALGQMAASHDAGVLEVLDQMASGSLASEIQARRFAMLSLGCLGGDVARANLLGRLPRAYPSLQPWIALGLGIHAFERRIVGRGLDPEVGQALADAFEQMGNPTWKAAIAVALGLAWRREAGYRILDAMDASQSPAFRGDCAVALWFMDFYEAEEDLRALLDRSVDRPDQQVQVAIALWIMGVGSAGTRELLKAFTKESKTETTQAGLAAVLGLMGDQRAVNPLVDLLLDRARTPGKRAAAAAALGSMGDKEDLPWNVRIGFGLNYLAATESLTGFPAGPWGRCP